MIEDFHQLNPKSKISFLRDLLGKEISDELREDISDYLLCVEADKEGEAIPYENYVKGRKTRKEAKKTKAK